MDTIYAHLDLANGRRIQVPTRRNRSQRGIVARPTSSLVQRWLGGLVLALVTLSAGAQEMLFDASEPEYDWSRNFRIGTMIGFNIKGNFKLSKSPDLSQYGAGIFDDGYVIPSPANPDDHLTSNWGYESDGQYNATALTLTMHRTTSFTATKQKSDGDGDLAYYGFDMAYGGVLLKRDFIKVGWEVGFGWIPIKINNTQQSYGSADQMAYTFSVPSSVGEIMPPAGYHGSGSDGEPGIYATNSAPQPSGSVSDVTLSTTNTLEVNLFTVRLGPTLYWDMSPSFGLSANASFVAGYVTGSYKYTDALSYSDLLRKGKVDMNEVVFGGSIGASLLYHAEENGDLYIGFQYMPMSSASASKNGHEVTLDLSGQIYLTAGVNWAF